MIKKPFFIGSEVLGGGRGENPKVLKVVKVLTLKVVGVLGGRNPPNKRALCLTEWEYISLCLLCCVFASFYSFRNRAKISVFTTKNQPHSREAKSRNLSFQIKLFCSRRVHVIKSVVQPTKRTRDFFFLKAGVLHRLD